MDMEIGDIAWFIAVVIGTIGLGVAIVYAQLQWRKRRRDRPTKRAQERAVKSLYDRPKDES